MEAFSLLKYWKSSSNSGGSSSSGKVSVTSTASPTTTIVSAVREDEDAEDDSASEDEGDDGPFFDLEFALPADDDKQEQSSGNVNEVEIEEEEEDDEEEEEEGEEVRELDPNMSFSPSDDLFFKGKIIGINGSDAATETDEVEDTELSNGNSKSGQFAVPVSLVKSATKLRVFMLGLKRSKSESKQMPLENNTTSKDGDNKSSVKFLKVKLKMEDMKVPIMSLLTRASSNSKPNNNNDVVEQHGEGKSVENTTENACENNNEKKEKKEAQVMQKYLKLVKPLYVKVSKRTHQDTTKGEVKKEKGVVRGERKKVGPRQGLNLKVIAKKHLGKSKSAVVHSMPSRSSSGTCSNNSTTSSKKRDDSLLQQQDGIQSAILHCKRSFNSCSSSSDDGEETTSVLTRSTSDPSHEKKSNVTSAVVAELLMMEEEERNGVVA